MPRGHCEILSSVRIRISDTCNCKLNLTDLELHVWERPCWLISIEEFKPIISGIAIYRVECTPISAGHCIGV